MNEESGLKGDRVKVFDGRLDHRQGTTDMLWIWTRHHNGLTCTGELDDNMDHRAGTG